MIEIWDKSKIKQARKDAEMTAETAVSVLSITAEYLSMLENGHRQPSQKLIGKMSALYRKPTAYFLKEEKNFASA